MISIRAVGGQELPEGYAPDKRMLVSPAQAMHFQFLVPGAYEFVVTDEAGKPIDTLRVKAVEWKSVVVELP